MVADECNINDEVGVSANVGALDDQVTLSSFSIWFHDGRDVASLRQQSGLVAEGFHRVENGFLSGLGAIPVCFLQECTWSPYSSVTWRAQAQTLRSFQKGPSAGIETPRT